MALTLIPNPYGMEWVEWVDNLASYNPQAFRIMEVGAMDWRVVVDRLTMLEPATPRHDTFSDWRDWAAQLKAVFPN